MAFDFKKEYREFYMPASKPSIVTVPAMNYIAVRGEGDEDSVEVFINGSSTKTTAGTDTFTVAGTTKGFTVTFAKTFILAHPAESVVVKYRAKLEGPVNLDGETSNTATITYNPNPSEDTDVTPPGPTDEQNIYGVVVFKYEDGTTTALQGAEFELWEGTIDPNDSTKVIKGTTKVKGPTATDENGLLAWDGLKDGVYALIETKAPANYRLDSNPRLVILNENQTLGDNPLTSDTETYFLRSEVPNTPGTTLPSTGGIGTTIFYVAGLVLVLGAAAVIIARRKAEQN